MKFIPTSEQSLCETKPRTSASKQNSFDGVTVTERIEKYRNERCLQFPLNLRPAYIAGFNNSISDATIAPIPIEFAGGDENTRAYCCGANDASLFLPDCNRK